jgi:hypothetical protein
MKILRVLIIIFTSLILFSLPIACILSTTKEKQIEATTKDKEHVTDISIEETNEIKIGEPVLVGEVQWKVIDVQKKDEIEQEFGEPLKPGGVFLIIKIEAELLGRESGSIYSSQLKVIDSQDRKFEPDNDAMISLLFEDIKPIFAEEIHPNVSKVGYVIFDIAKDAEGLKLQIKDARLLSSAFAIVDLETDKIQSSEEFEIPTELEVREKIEQGISEVTNLMSDRLSLHKLVDWLPKDWRSGILVVRDDNPTRWGKGAEIYYYLMVISQGGTLYITYGVQNIYYYKSWTEVKTSIMSNYPPEETNFSDGSFIFVEIWRDDTIWSQDNLWKDDIYWGSENFWDIHQK